MIPPPHNPAGATAPFPGAPMAQPGMPMMHPAQLAGLQAQAQQMRMMQQMQAMQAAAAGGFAPMPSPYPSNPYGAVNPYAPQPTANPYAAAPNPYAPQPAFGGDKGGNKGFGKGFGKGKDGKGKFKGKGKGKGKGKFEGKDRGDKEGEENAEGDEGEKEEKPKTETSSIMDAQRNARLRFEKDITDRLQGRWMDKEDNATIYTVEGNLCCVASSDGGRVFRNRLSVYGHEFCWDARRFWHYIDLKALYAQEDNVEICEWEPAKDSPPTKPIVWLRAPPLPEPTEEEKAAAEAAAKEEEEKKAAVEEATEAPKKASEGEGEATAASVAEAAIVSSEDGGS